MHEDVDLTHHRPISASIHTKQHMKRLGKRNHQNSRILGIKTRMPKIDSNINLWRTTSRSIPKWDKKITRNANISLPKNMPADRNEKISLEFAQKFP
ncbi:hypothetical protein MA16_Dca010341 [Dendrobium catenatum]|uniref:Uncharacterized protein n=1 Tax=Dendrobium catenatum TaxID=906689 RepID=A0A2I0X805_9ASPA|nr:hypothetical protein MA16_Dca010341 [Dendrobium catenatum]